MYIYIYVTRQIMSQKWNLKKNQIPSPTTLKIIIE